MRGNSAVLPENLYDILPSLIKRTFSRDEDAGQAHRNVKQSLVAIIDNNDGGNPIHCLKEGH